LPSWKPPADCTPTMALAWKASQVMAPE
jgi:hypothetical protein